MTVAAAIARAAQRPPRTRLTDAVLDAEVLLAHVLNIERVQLLAHPEKRLTNRQAAQYSRLVRRCRTGRPVAYLTGKQEFWGRVFRVSPATLIPRPETETLVEEALKRIPKQAKGTVADVGTGSGCIGITLACERPNLHVIAADLSVRALAVARRNAQVLGVRRRMVFRRGDLLNAIPRNAAPRLIVANLPYLPSRRGRRSGVFAHEPPSALAGGWDGLSVYRRLFPQIQKRYPSALILCEFDPRQTAQLMSIGRQAGFTATVAPDLSGRDRVMIFEKRR